MQAYTFCFLTNFMLPQGVVLLDEHFLRSEWPMWELGIMMAALRQSNGGPSASQPGSLQQASRTVLPVVLMEFATVKPAYTQHWQHATVEAAAGKGFQPATLADLQRLLEYGAIRQDQVRLPSLPCVHEALSSACAFKRLQVHAVLCTWEVLLRV